ncbi:MAG: DUF2249 domain-containing protein [Steroidobacteraceae bacterium]
MIEPLTVDVREELRRGGEPLSRILQAVNELVPGQALRLLATFEPLPLYAVLGSKGFGHSAKSLGAGDWEVIFTPEAVPVRQAGAARVASDASLAGWPKPSTYLDNRGLEPPAPLVRILDALERLGAGEVLEALNERDPVFLYPELQARGAAIHTDKVSGGIRILIRRAG